MPRLMQKAITFEWQTLARGRRVGGRGGMWERGSRGKAKTKNDNERLHRGEREGEERRGGMWESGESGNKMCWAMQDARCFESLIFLWFA